MKFVYGDGFPSQWFVRRRWPPYVWTLLVEAAGRLRADQHTAPVRIKDIFDKIGVRVEFRSSLKAGSAYLEWDRAEAAAPTVLLADKKSSPWTRFCAAHELGHYVLISDFSWHPTTDSEYWQTEVLCDFFARQLLLPPTLFESVEADAEQLLVGCGSISAQAVVPWTQVAKRVTEHDPRLVLLRLEQEASGRFVVKRSSLPLDKGRGMKLGRRTGFHTAASAALNRQRKSESEPVSWRLSRDDFLGTSLGELFSELAVRDIVFQRSTSRIIDLAGVRSVSKSPVPTSTPP